MTTPDEFDRIYALILSFLQGNIPPAEFGKLKEWISLSSENKAYFRKMFLIWKAETVAGEDPETVERAFQKVYRQTISEETTSSKEISGHSLFRSMGKWAAVILISIGSGAVLNHFILEKRTKELNVSINEINVPLGSKSRIVLPDSSEVWLNAGSKLTYSTSYGDKYRLVNLTGEGYFKVHKDPARPFIVHTSRANIRAIGTEFNVKAYPEENTVETILVSGSVVVNKIVAAENKEMNGVILRPHQKVLFYNEADSSNQENFPEIDSPLAENHGSKTEPYGMSLEESNTDVETSWKDPSWVIQGEGLPDLCVELGRRFNVAVIHIDEKLNKYKFSGTIQKETLEQVFDLMKLTIPMSYVIEKGKVTITLNSNLESKYKRAYNN